MERSAWRWGCLALVGALLLLLVPGMASLGLWAPDEPRAAAVAREMFAMERGLESLVLLRLNGEAYTQKPPLYYWLVSVASLVPGQVEEWTARLPSALAGVGTLILTLLLGRRLFGPRTALLGAALLLTSYKFVHLSRRAQAESTGGPFAVTGWGISCSSSSSSSSVRESCQPASRPVFSTSFVVRSQLIPRQSWCASASAKPRE